MKEQEWIENVPEGTSRECPQVGRQEEDDNQLRREAKAVGFEQWYHIIERNTIMSIGKTVVLDKVPFKKGIYGRLEWDCRLRIMKYSKRVHSACKRTTWRRERGELLYKLVGGRCLDLLCFFF